MGQIYMLYERIRIQIPFTILIYYYHCSENGGWSDWSEYTTCSATCQGGKQQRTRTCTNPPPSAGGLGCEEEASNERSCNELVDCKSKL